MDRFTITGAFDELLEMEEAGLINDEDSSLQMLMIYFGTYCQLEDVMLVNKWVIVACAGTIDEHIHSEHGMWNEAMTEMDSLDNDSFISGFDIMKRLPDGSLTTDY